MIVTRTEACNLITGMLNNDTQLEGEDLEKVIFAVNEDLQVRDWMMGIPITWSVEEGIKFTQYMAIRATPEDSVPFTTVQAQFYYESGDIEKALKLIEYSLKMNKDYSLAKLLRRVVQAQWPVDAFQAMRVTLHPKVLESCYGEKGNQPLPVEEEEEE